MVLIARQSKLASTRACANGAATHSWLRGCRTGARNERSDPLLNEASPRQPRRLRRGDAIRAGCRSTNATRLRQFKALRSILPIRAIANCAPRYLCKTRACLASSLYSNGKKAKSSPLSFDKTPSALQMDTRCRTWLKCLAHTAQTMRYIQTAKLPRFTKT